jgi:hypothetical protein
MKRATITLSADIEEALEAYRRDQEAPPALTSVAQAALREYLAERGYLPRARSLRITPAPKGSGKRDISVEHDRYFAEG